MPPVLRPPRLTPRLQLPVPGDAGPADYVTDTGAICDRLEQTVGVSQPVTSPPANPAVGEEIVLRLPLSSAGGAPFVYWRLRFNGSGWDFLGGPPLYTAAGGTVTITADWGYQSTPPGIVVPLSGYYLARHGAELNFYGIAGANGIAFQALRDLTVGLGPEPVQNVQAVGTPNGGGGGSVGLTVRIALVAGHSYGLSHGTNNQEARLGFRYLELLPAGELT